MAATDRAVVANYKDTTGMLAKLCGELQFNWVCV